MSNPVKKGFGVYVTILAAILAVAAGILFQVVGGKFGAMQRNCYDLAIVGLLIGGAVVSIALVALKKFGLAPAVVTAATFAAVLMYVHKGYWYVVDVFMDIDEHGFDPKWIAFVALCVAVLVIGELAIYTPKTRKVKA